MPGGVIVSAMHDKAYGARGISFTEQVSDLTVGHHPPAWNSANDPKYTFAILAIRLSFTCRHATPFATLRARARRPRRRQRSSLADKSVRSRLPAQRSN